MTKNLHDPFNKSVSIDFKVKPSEEGNRTAKEKSTGDIQH
jgi:hypothetical protein